MSSYIDHKTGGGGVTYRWEAHTYRNLREQYGWHRAAQIMSGQDPRTQSDIHAWRSLGRRDAA